MKKISTLLFATLLFYFSSFSQSVYHVSPNGDDAWDGLSATHLGGTNGPWKSVAQANATVVAGDIVELHAGTYSGQIRPANSGTSNSNRITYRPAGDGPVIFNTCHNGDGHFMGSIALGLRNYITVTGRSSGGPADERMIQLQLSGSCNAYGNAAGSEGCIIENITMEHFDPIYSPDRGFLFADYWWPGDYETKYCILRNCIIDGYVRGDSAYNRMEDVVSIAKNAHHLLIENNQLGLCKHVSLNLNEATTEKIVIRNNIINNPDHTALSLYGFGDTVPTIQRLHLIEYNILLASGSNASPSGGPGSALQMGASQSIVRHNIIAESGGPAANQYIAGWSGTVGATSDQGVMLLTDNRTYNNTIVNSHCISVALFYFGNTIQDKGRNKFVNNVIYDGHGNDLAHYLSPTHDDGKDRWISNIFGNPGSQESDAIINVGYGPVDLTTAINNYQNPSDPDFSAWEGFENQYSGDLMFDNYSSTYQVSEGTIATDGGAPLTKVSDSDAGSGTTLIVDDARFFYGTAAEFPSWMGVQSEWIAVGQSIGNSTKVQIASVDHTDNRITLTQSIQRTNGDFVWLWKDSRGDIVIEGSAPDIGASEYAGDALSMQLVSFDVFRENGFVKIQWRTIYEADNNYYDVERSKNGKSWSSIGQVPALNNWEQNDYEFIDQNPPKGKVYYRLALHENSGDIIYSPIRSISNKRSIAVYPNPSPGLLHIDVDDINVIGKVVVKNQLHQIVYSIKTRQDSEVLNIDLSHLHEGIYWIELINPVGGIIQTEKILIGTSE